MRKDATVSCRLTEEEKAALMAIAAEKDIPLSKVVRDIIRAHLEDQKNERH